MAESVRKTYQEKLRPTPAQERPLELVLWRCRTLYHIALEQRILLWRERGICVSRYQQEVELKDLRAEMPAYAALHSHVLQDVLARLDRTYQAFFRRLQSGEKPGFPRFQGRNRSHSCTYKAYGNGARLDNGYLVLSQIGRIAVRWSRPVDGTVKTITLSKEADGWYVSRSCAALPIQPLPPTGQETGIDVGLKVFLVTADGGGTETPRHYRKGEKALKKAQRRVSRRTKGSNRRRKAGAILAKRHQHVRRQRRDFHHKTAVALVRAYDYIYLEDLRVANLVGNHHLSKSISDAGWAQFRTILEAKAACAGRQVVAVPPAFTSQDCSGCGARVAQGLSVRTHMCTACGLLLDRDEHAAKHIHWRAQRLRGLAAVAAGMNREPARLSPKRSVSSS